MSKAIGANLLRYKKDQLYLVADGETENLNLILNNRPWQWSYQRYKGNQLIESHDEFIWWPDLKVSKEAAFITRFDYNVYKSKAGDPKEKIDKFNQYLYDPNYIIIGANYGNFDSFIHGTWGKLVGITPDYSYFDRIYDIQCVEKAIELQIDIPKDRQEYLSFLFKTYGFRKRTLKTSVKFLLKKYEIPFDEFLLHDGIYDVAKCKEIFDKQIWKKEV